MKSWLGVLIVILFLSSCAQEFVQYPEDPNANLSQSAAVQLKSLQFVSADTIELTQGQTKTLWMQFTPTIGTPFQNTGQMFQSRYGNLIWYSNDDYIVSVSDNGVLVAKNPGSTTILVTYQNKSAVVSVTVLEDQIQTVQFSNEALIVEDNSQVLTFDVIYESGRSLSHQLLTDFQTQLSCSPLFNLSNESVASVNVAGEIFPLSNGTVQVEFVCGSATDVMNVTVQNLSTEVGYGDPSSITDTLTSLQIDALTTDEFEVNTQTILSVDLEFATAGPINNISSLFSLNDELYQLNWSSSNEAVATVSDGRVTFLDYGFVDITAEFLGVSDTVRLFSKKVPDRLSSTLDAFLSADDVYSFNLGANASRTSDITAVYGAPSGTMDVFSIGELGEVVIELKDYYLVDGLGDDLSLFENPFSGWYECAEVSVSQDGSTYYDFACDQYDATETFAGCAGVGIVNSGLSHSAYLNSNLSGGDQFDLATVGLEWAKYIKITDVGLCSTSTSSTYSGPLNGFDLDAIAVLNGEYE